MAEVRTRCCAGLVDPFPGPVPFERGNFFRSCSYRTDTDRFLLFSPFRINFLCMLAGVDGCRAGWIAVFFEKDSFTYCLYPYFKDLIKQNPRLKRVLIDIPLGLSSPGYPRTVDAHLRKELPGRGCTVFNVPCRAAVYEQDKAKARAHHIRVEGKSLSEQSLNICGKIRDVDVLLPLEKGPVILESHPEAGFKSLNHRQVLLSKKNTPEGANERLRLLQKADPPTVKLFEEICGSFKKKDVKPDDILDALCLCVVNKLAGERGLRYLEDENNRDERGIPIKIALLNPGPSIP